MVETRHPRTQSASLSPTTVSVDLNSRDSPSLIRDAIIDDLSVETRPTSDYVLPETDTLTTAVSAVEEYLYEYGVAVTAALHLDGFAAPVTYTGSGNMYTAFDSDAFTDIVTETVAAIDGVDATETLISAVTFAFELESKRQFQSRDVSIDAANWPAVTGKRTDTAIPLVIETPHPLIEINTHRSMYDRAMAVIAGVQRLTDDAGSVVGQRDIGAYVMYHALIAGGESELRARQSTASIYGIEEDTLHGLLATVESEIAEVIDGQDNDIESRYYMPSDVVRQVF